MNDLVSIIILTYNNLQFIEYTVNSALNQDYNNIEIIISDDASEKFDYSYINKIFLKASKNLKNFIIHKNRKNLGIVKNFNNAIKMSNGKFIIPLSCGDEFENTHVISLIKDHFDQTGCLVLTGKRKVIDEIGNEINILPSKQDINILMGDKRKLLKRMYTGNFIFGACTYYSRAVFDKYGFFDENFILLEDYPFYLKLLQYGENIGFINNITIKYRTGGVSSGKKHPLLMADDKQVYEKILFPMKYELGYITYRRLKIRYHREYDKDNKKILKVELIKYIDIIFFDFLIRISNKIKRIINNGKN